MGLVGRRALAALILAVVLLDSPAARAAGPVLDSPSSFGIDFVSAPGSSFANQSQRYVSALTTGAGWNRWVIYWSSVEARCNQAYDWSAVDPIVQSDQAAGLSDDAVLLGTPSCYATGSGAASIPPLVAARHGGIHTLSGLATSPPSGLYQPAFADGTDNWWPGKAVNPNNPWASFVNAAVARYRGQVHNWEIWNEPDFSQFWSGSINDYARLLKVAYLAAHAADPGARILIGGMMYWEWTNRYGTDQAWLKQFLPIITSDPAAAGNGDYFDVIPWHWYSRSMDVYTHLLSAQSVLASNGITGKELWVNETNAPACGDNAPGVAYVACAPDGPPGYADDTEQASFVVQAAAYAFAAGATRVFQFQEQDDGNGQAFGLFRNDGSTRPADEAYQLAVQYLAGFAVVHRSVVDGADMITFGVPGSSPHRVTVLWDDAGTSTTATVAAAGVAPNDVLLVRQDGWLASLNPASSYAIQLPGATDARNYDQQWNPNDFSIGGQTWFLVEELPPDASPPRSMATVSATSPSTVSLTWNGSDPGGWGVADYTIQARDTTSGGAWTTWLANTTATSATFAAASGHTYQFRSVARDWAGNLESKCGADVTASAKALVRAAGTPIYSHQYYFPLVGSAPAPSC